MEENLQKYIQQVTSHIVYNKISYKQYFIPASKEDFKNIGFLC